MNHKLVIAVLSTLSALPAPAFADKADEVFKQGKKLMAEKKYAEACPKFEKSYQIDPGIGGQLNVGKCYEEWGKLGKAYRAYTDALKKAEESNDNRAEKIKKLVAQLEPQRSAPRDPYPARRRYRRTASRDRWRRDHRRRSRESTARRSGSEANRVRARQRCTQDQDRPGRAQRHVGDHARPAEDEGQARETETRSHRGRRGEAAASTTSPRSPITPVTASASQVS